MSFLSDANVGWAKDQDSELAFQRELAGGSKTPGVGPVGHGSGQWAYRGHVFGAGTKACAEDAAAREAAGEDLGWS